MSDSDQKSGDSIIFNRKSDISSALRKPPPLYQLANNFTSFFETQIYDSTDEVDLVIGLDFGTASTKVVIMEDTTKKAWAVPFVIDNHPYLIPSMVYCRDDLYQLEGEPSNAIGRLKLPMILGKAYAKHLVNVVAFLALVIRYSRGWFLHNAATTFHNTHFNWHYHLGFPASNFDNKELVNLFTHVLHCAAIVAESSSPMIERANVLKIYQRYFSRKVNPEDYPVHPDLVATFPEIAAQLHGYVNSDKWDKSRPKFMLVDVGGGTVDAAIVNVIRDAGKQLKYVFLRSRVKPLGIMMLHNKRLGWIAESLKVSEENEHLKQVLEDIRRRSFEKEILPTIEDYLVNVIWPEGTHIDTDFYNEYGDLLLQEIIVPVKKTIDPEIEQWKSLQYVVCGGGSLHPLYCKFHHHMNSQTNTHVKLDVVKIDVPDNFYAEDVTSENFHRLSVAYGLAHFELGGFVPESSIQPVNDERVSKASIMITKDMM